MTELLRKRIEAAPDESRQTSKSSLCPPQLTLGPVQRPTGPKCQIQPNSLAGLNRSRTDTRRLDRDRLHSGPPFLFTFRMFAPTTAGFRHAALDRAAARASQPQTARAPSDSRRLADLQNQL